MIKRTLSAAGGKKM
jgi:hypothetical protein